MDIPKWIIKTLKENGNCAVKGTVAYCTNVTKLLTAIEEEVGFKVQLRFDGDGYIIEKVKN